MLSIWIPLRAALISGQCGTKLSLRCCTRLSRHSKWQAAAVVAEELLRQGHWTSDASIISYRWRRPPFKRWKQMRPSHSTWKFSDVATDRSNHQRNIYIEYYFLCLRSSNLARSIGEMSAQCHYRKSRLIAFSIPPPPSKRQHKVHPVTYRVARQRVQMGPHFLSLRATA